MDPGGGGASVAAAPRSMNRKKKKTKKKERKKDRQKERKNVTKERNKLETVVSASRHWYTGKFIFDFTCFVKTFE